MNLKYQLGLPPVTQDLIRNLVFEYWGAVAANPEWHKNQYQYLIDRGIPAKNLYDYGITEDGEDA